MNQAQAEHGLREQWDADAAMRTQQDKPNQTQLDKDMNMPRTSEMIESRYLKKEEVGEEGTIVTVADFERVNVAQDDQPPDNKWTMRFEEFDKPMVLNSTNIQLAENVLGSDNTDDWIGKKLIVYNDPNITFGKKLVGGIRIRAHRKAAPPRKMAPRTADQVNRELNEAEGAGGDPDF